ncbi:hypothetical protein HY990_06820 [Candidatus Micrarchaeota archaeon]|nr:hypothetical protein [Candidatus Micrarchaeota archaeon]
MGDPTGQIQIPGPTQAQTTSFEVNSRLIPPALQTRLEQICAVRGWDIKEMTNYIQNGQVSSHDGQQIGIGYPRDSSGTIRSPQLPSDGLLFAQNIMANMHRSNGRPTSTPNYSNVDGLVRSALASASQGLVSSEVIRQVQFEPQTASFIARECRRLGVEPSTITNALAEYRANMQIDPQVAAETLDRRAGSLPNNRANVFLHELAGNLQNTPRYSSTEREQLFVTRDDQRGARSATRNAPRVAPEPREEVTLPEPEQGHLHDLNVLAALPIRIR